MGLALAKTFGQAASPTLTPTQHLGNKGPVAAPLKLG